jgi:hypothetical protein
MSRKRAIWPLLAVTALAGPAAALPLGLPGPSLPSAPSLPATGPLTDRLGNTLGNTAQTLRRDLVGRPAVPANTFDRDDNGFRVVRREILAIGPSEQAIEAARARGFEVLRSDVLDPLGLSVTVLKTPSGMRASEALRTLRSADPEGRYEYDHIYDPSAASERPSGSGLSSGPGLRADAIGIVDGGIDLKHDAFEAADIVTFNAASKASVPTAHGTAIASLLVGSHGRWHGAVAGARLYAADAFGGLPSGGSAAAIARGLSWLAGNDVAVINISLSGPPNALVAAAIRALVAKGFVVIAAVGNDGPSVPVSFPASCDGVVAVTSVDTARHVQLDANRGAAVMFASTGVDVRAAKPGGSFTDVTGTSFAAPAVAAMFAALVAHPDPAAARNARAKLAGLAIDLGAPGRDPVYGYGYLGAAPDSTANAMR